LRAYAEFSTKTPGIAGNGHAHRRNLRHGGNRGKKKSGNLPSLDFEVSLAFACHDSCRVLAEFSPDSHCPAMRRSWLRQGGGTAGQDSPVEKEENLTKIDPVDWRGFPPRIKIIFSP
jgi:hypothetical protein